MKRILLIVTCLCCFNSLIAQEDAWVYLIDKANVATAIGNPVSILTQKAIDRKNRHGIAIDERDVPVNESYITDLKSQSGISVLAKSKWLNAVHVRGSIADINALKNLAYVNSVDFADKSLNASKTVNQKNASKFQQETIVYNYGNAANQAQMINVDKLHEADYTGAGMTIAVLDGYFQNVLTLNAFKRMRDLGNLKGTYNFVTRNEDVSTASTGNHGTMVLSTMAGYVDNTFVGTAPDAAYYLFVTEDDLSETPVEESYWVEAAERADSLGVDVINTSLGYGAFYDNLNYRYSNTDYDGVTTFITRGANIASEKGLLVVNSAGNEGNNGLNAPADSAGILSVGAVDGSGNKAWFSSVGSNIQPTIKPDVVAQGQSSAVIDENDVIGLADGTSFSSPILAGALACLWQALPDKTNLELMQLVRASASQYNSPDYLLGYGIPDLYGTLNSALSISNNTLNDMACFPNPVKDIFYIQLPQDLEGMPLKIYNVIGKLMMQKTMDKSVNSLDLSDLTSGIYFVRLEDQNQSKTIKLVKQ